MKPLHGVTDKKLVSGGANYDQHENFVALSQKGEYIDAHNMQHPIDGNGQALKKIGGEEEKYPATANACSAVNNSGLPASFTTYKCIGTAHFFEQDNNQDRTIEFWVDSEGVFPPIIRIDGIIVAGSPDIPFTYPNYLQLDVNENCVGGEIYITDNNVSPMIFNLTDLMVNSSMIADENGDFICTEKYFAGYNNSLYTLELLGSNNHPIFIQLTDSPPVNSITIGSAGMTAGQYQYQIRPATEAGDRGGWCEATPLIPMPARQGAGSDAYPYNKTFGADVNVSSILGIHLRYRVDNRANYEFLEIKRIRHNIGAALDAAGEEFLIDFRIPLTPQQLEVIDIYDRGAAELPLTDDDKDESYSVINRAKSLRYYNQRLHLMNIKYAARDVQATFKEINDKKMFPVIEPIGQAGHKDPYHHTYHRSLMNGEKYGWAVMFRDANNQKTFAQQVGTDTAGNNFDNYEMPNRRVEASAETLQYSSIAVQAADVNNRIKQTHEVFYTNFADYKTDTSTTLNISLHGNPGYARFTPVNQADGDVSGHNINPNPQVRISAPNNMVAYRPKCFGLNYFALGMAMAGVENIPSHIKSFSVVRTQPAGRVYCQGLGYYKLESAPTTTSNFTYGAITAKIANKFWFYSPDGDPDTGVRDMDLVINDIITNGTASRYKAQLVSPLGFFTEVYSSHSLTHFGATRSGCVDMVNYVRILNEARDGTNPTIDTIINVGDSIDTAFEGANGVGISDGSISPNQRGYIGYGKWRRRTMPSGAEAWSPTNPDTNSGEYEFNITALSRKENTITNSRSKYYDLTLEKNVYNFVSYDILSGSRVFSGVDVRNWHEPMYITNIIDTLAEVPNTNINNYIETGHYQKTEATIGKTTGVAEGFVLVDERREDAFATSTTDGVIFIETDNGTEYWQDITVYTAAQQAVILAAIAAGTQTAVFNGVTYNISGAYTRSSTTIGSYIQHTINFTATNGIPDPDSLVIVRYKTTEPIKIFGGDTTTHEAIFCPIDGTSNPDGTPSTGANLSVPYPYDKFTLYNNRIFEANTPLSYDNDPYCVGNNTLISNFQGASFIRQLVAVFTCQSRVNLPFEYEINQATTAVMTKYFPATHYIMRPADWDTTDTTPTLAQGNFLYPQYDTDYPREAETFWGYGGFRFNAQTNLDYGKQDINHTITSKPKVGFTEETEFCTRDVWSVIRPINAIDSPGVRTFPALNFFDISDDTGEIKLAWDDDVQDRGNNLYAITESGICLLITDKTLLFDKTGAELAAIGSSDSAVVRDQIWLSKIIGMSDELWRGSAEGFTVLENNARKQTLFFPNKNSVYKLVQGQILDIARDASYHSRIFPVIQQIGKRFIDNITGGYDTLNDAYLLQIQLVLDSNVRPNTYKTSEVFVYEEKNKKFVGTYAYGFDKYLSFNNKTFGMRKLQTFELFKGLLINGANIDCWVVDATTNKLEPSEYYYVKVDSNTQPHQIEFYNSKSQYLAGQVQALIDTDLNALALKQYYGWANYVPRKNIGVNHRMEGESMVFRVKHNRPESFVITTMDIESKLLK